MGNFSGKGTAEKAAPPTTSFDAMESVKDSFDAMGSVKEFCKSAETWDSGESCVLIGSRAAAVVCSDFRAVDSSDWDLVVSPRFLVAWLDSHVDEILMIKHHGDSVVCLLGRQRYDFEVAVSLQGSALALLRYSPLHPHEAGTEEYPLASPRCLLALKDSHLLHASPSWQKHAADRCALFEVVKQGPSVDEEFAKSFLQLRCQETEERRCAPPRGDATVQGYSAEAYNAMPAHEQRDVLRACLNAMMPSAPLVAAAEYACTCGPALWLSRAVIEHFDYLRHCEDQLSPAHEEVTVSNERGRVVYSQLFPSLPEEINALIVQYLAANSGLAGMCGVCTAWRNLSCDRHVWARAARLRWPDLPDHLMTEGRISYEAAASVREMDVDTVAYAIALRKTTPESIGEVWHALYSAAVRGTSRRSFGRVFVPCEEGEPAVEKNFPAPDAATCRALARFVRSCSVESVVRIVGAPNELKVCLDVGVDPLPAQLASFSSRFVTLRSYSGIRGTSRTEYQCIQTTITCGSEMYKFDGASVTGRYYDEWGRSGMVQLDSLEEVKAFGLPAGLLVALVLQLLPFPERSETRSYMIDAMQT